MAPGLDAFDVLLEVVLSLVRVPITLRVIFSDPFRITMQLKGVHVTVTGDFQPF